MQDLLRMQNVIELFKNEEPAFRMILRRWNAIKETERILAIIYKQTLAVQKFDFTLSDFFGSWLRSELELNELSGIAGVTNLADKLVEALHNRKKELIDTRAMICALLLDPRYKSELTSDQIELGKMMFADLESKIEELQAKEAQPEASESRVDESGDLLEQYFLQKGQENPSFNGAGSSTYSNNSTMGNSKTELYKEIDSFLEAPRMHNKSSLLAYWEKQQGVFPRLYKIANIINAIPPSQATIERAFSVLALIYNSRRSRCSKYVLEDLLNISLNKEVALKIFQEEIDHVNLKT